MQEAEAWQSRSGTAWLDETLGKPSDVLYLRPETKLWHGQELMLILEEFWARNAYLQHTPIYTISGIAARALGIYQTYIEMMGEDIKQAFAAVRVLPLFSHSVYLSWHACSC